MQNSNDKPQPKTWWKRKEIIGGCGLVILNTLASPIVGSINPFIPLVANMSLGILTVTGLAKGIEAQNLALTKKNYKIE
jgi:hypothetical protein